MDNKKAEIDIGNSCILNIVEGSSVQMSGGLYQQNPVKFKNEIFNITNKPGEEQNK